jgi:superfamily II DNA/RNA helicase
VATDIVARGIDIDDIQMVINFDVPHDAEDYVHRIGRTARANRDGRAITFVNEKDFSQFKQIERFLEKEIEKTPLPDGLEAPHYKEEQKGKNSRKKKSGGKKNGNKKANGQPKAAAENAAPASVEKSAEAGGNSAEAPKKKRKHHHRRKKSGNAPQEGGTQTPASAPVDNATGKE